MLKQLLYLAAFLCSYATAQQAIQYTGCGGEVKAVRAYPCVAEPCTFKKGDETKIEIDFVSNQLSSTMNLKVSARIFGFDLPFPGMENGADGCDGSGITCPILNGQTLTFKTALDVPGYAPSIKTTATFKVEGDEGVVLCFQAPVQVK